MYANVFVVHGFRQSVYDVEEDNRLDIEFALNVVGTTQLTTLVVSGTITSEADGTTSELYISMKSSIGSSLCNIIPQEALIMRG